MQAQARERIAALGDSLESFQGSTVTISSETIDVDNRWDKRIHRAYELAEELSAASIVLCPYERVHGT